MAMTGRNYAKRRFGDQITTEMCKDYSVSRYNFDVSWRKLGGNNLAA